MILATALMCLATNIYWESRGESLTGQHAVAQVTMNRAMRDPKNVCEVVAKSKQFSWTNRSFGLVKRKHGELILTEKGEPADKKAWMMAKNIAALTLKGWIPDFTHGAMFYHTKSVNPVWDNHMRLVARYGNHLFYKYA